MQADKKREKAKKGTVMTKTQILTDWICIAKSGATVDGREILSRDLLDIAETYSAEKYTANIWLEHYRFSNLGQVHEVKAETFMDEDGQERVKLFARIAPSLDLLQYNKRGQGLFTSIEIKPNFVGSGKTYLTGLAVTDSPASTHTTQLHFSKRVADTDVVFGNFEPLQFNLERNDNEEKGFFRRFLAWLNTESNNEFSANHGTENKETETHMTEKDKEDLKAVIATAIGEAFAAQTRAQTAPQSTTAQPPQPQATDAQQTDAQAQTVSVEAFNALKADFDALSEKFNAAVNTEKTVIPTGANGFSGAIKVDTAI